MVEFASLIFTFISYISPSLSLLAACVALIAYGIPVLILKNILKRVSTILSLDVASQVHNIKTSFEGFRDIKIWELVISLNRLMKSHQMLLMQEKLVLYGA